MRLLCSLVSVLAFATVIGLCAPARAWGPVTQLSLVRAGTHLLSQDGSIPLVKLERYVREGAQVSDEGMMDLNPLFEIDAVGAIQREMFLLQAVRGERVDPYYAYRLAGGESTWTQACAGIMPYVASRNDQHA